MGELVTARSTDESNLDGTLSTGTLHSVILPGDDKHLKREGFSFTSVKSFDDGGTRTPAGSRGQSEPGGMASGIPQLFSWLDIEVKARLLSMNKKLDQLLDERREPSISYLSPMDAHRSTLTNNPEKSSDNQRSTLTVLSPLGSPRPPPLSQASNLMAFGARGSKDSRSGGNDGSGSHHVGFSPSTTGNLERKHSSSPRGTKDTHGLYDVVSSFRGPSIDDNEVEVISGDEHHPHHVQIGSHDHHEGDHSEDFTDSVRRMQSTGTSHQVIHIRTNGHHPHHPHHGHRDSGGGFLACPSVPNRMVNERKATVFQVIMDKIRKEIHSHAGRFSNILIGSRRKPHNFGGVIRRTRCEWLWHFLEDEESSYGALIYSECMNVFAVLTVFCTMMQSTDPPIIQGIPASLLESLFDIVFGTEFLIRFVVCPSWFHFISSPFNWLDLGLGLVLPLRVAIGFDLDQMSKDDFWRHFFLLGLPVLRMLKTLRRFQKLHLVLKAVEQAMEAVPVLLWTLLVAVIWFSTLIFLLEPRENVPTWTKAIWLTIVTMSTVGYGDVYPVSMGGTIVTASLIVVSVLYMAMPIGIIGQTFGSIWHDRDRILLMQQTRKRLLQWGYTAEDIPIIFSLFDEDGNSELDLPEFRRMIKEMGLGIREERVLALFDSLDVDAGGAIDDKEFVRNVFPQEFHRLYQVDLCAAEEANLAARASTLSARGLQSNPANMLQRAKTLEKLGRIHTLEAMENKKHDPKQSTFSGVSTATRFSGRCSKKSIYVTRPHVASGLSSAAQHNLKNRLSCDSRRSGFKSVYSQQSIQSLDAVLPVKKEEVFENVLPPVLSDAGTDTQSSQAHFDDNGQSPRQVKMASGFTIHHSSHDAPGVVK